jgi:aminoglycoside phosphotransferase (APT) family kinase protein
MQSKKASAGQVDKFRDLARMVLEHHFGNRPGRITYKSAGLSNFVFDAKHAEGEFIVRISPDKARLDAFIKEHWTEQAARKAGVPTAEILETGISVIPFPYAISRSVQGIDATDHPERNRIVGELGRMAARINSIRTRGFGETFDWSNNALSLNKTLKEYLEGEYRYRERIETLERARLVPAATIKAVKKIMLDLVKLKARPVLNHGDLRLKNVIADEAGKIIAIIDWEKATSNIAPHWEFSIALHDLGIDGQQQFIDGYGIKPKRLLEIIPFVKSFNMLNYVDEINRLTAAKDKQALERLGARLAGTFDLYSF